MTKKDIRIQSLAQRQQLSLPQCHAMVASMLEQLKSAWEKVFFGHPDEPGLAAAPLTSTMTPSGTPLTVRAAGSLR